MKFPLLTISALLFSLLIRAEFASAQCGYTVHLASMGAPCTGSTPVVVTGAAAATNIELIDSNGNYVSSNDYPGDTVLFGVANPGIYRAIVSFGNCYDTTNGLTIFPSITNSINISTPHDTVCSGGSNIIFSAISNGTTKYQWQVNGANEGSNSSTFTGNLNNGDVVSCIGYDTDQCTTPNMAFSNSIKMTIDENLPITITPNPVCLGATLFLNNASQAESIIWKNGNFGAQYNATPLIKIRAGNNNYYGSALNELEPQNIFTDSAGDFYVLDNANKRVLYFKAGSDSSTKGIIIAGSDSTGGGTNRPVAPQGMCLDSKKNVFIVDQQLSGISRILEFPAGSTQSTDGIVIYTFAEFLYPEQIGSDGQDNLYVYETANGNTFKFEPNDYGGYSYVGTLSAVGFSLIDKAGNFYAIDFNDQSIMELTAEYINTGLGNPLVIAGGNGKGTAANQFYYPVAIMFDASGNLYVLDYGDGFYGGRLQKFPPGSTSATNGVTVAEAVSDGNGYITNMAIDGHDNFYFSLYADYPVLGNVTEVFPGLTSIDTSYTPLTPGSYTALVQTAAGCHNITTAPDSVMPLSYNYITAAICYGETYTVAGIAYDTVGFFTDTLMGAAASGCDSIINLQLGVDYVTESTPSFYLTNGDTNDIIGDTLVAGVPNGYGYNFLWTLNGQPLNTDSSDEIIVEAFGTYGAIAVGQTGCTSKPGYVTLGTEGIEVPSITNNVSVYPNPNNGNFTLKSENILGSTYFVYNMIGQCISQGMVHLNSQPIELNGAVDGVYNVIIKDDHASASTRFVIAR